MDDESLVLDRIESSSDDSVGAPVLAEDVHTDAVAPSDYTSDVDTQSADLPAAVEESPIHLAQDEPAPEPTTLQVVEALLFSSDAPLSQGRLAELAACTGAQARKAVEALNEKYADAGLTFRIQLIARGYQMLTLPDFQPWLAKLNKHRSQTRLSGAALETLSIVAYKQPIIRADVEAIRGVACGEVLNRLREMGLVKIAGRAEVIGRPLLYGTTRKFLDIFGLSDLDDLPPMEALSLRRATSVPTEPAEPTPDVPVAASA